MRSIVIMVGLIVTLSFGQRDIWSVMEEVNERMGVHEEVLRNRFKGTEDATKSWVCLAAANAIGKNQWLLLATTYRAEYVREDKSSILDGINSARRELRSYLAISETRDQINGVLDVLDYGEREIKKADFAK